jgi:hypothetical protein
MLDLQLVTPLSKVTRGNSSAHMWGEPTGPT